MVLTTYGRSSGFCVDPIEKKPLNQFYPGTSDALVRHRRAATSPASSARTGTSPSRARWTGCRTRPRREAIAAGRGAARLQVGGLHLQRPGDLRRVRHGHRRCLPRHGRADRRRHRGLHPRRAAARVLRQDGRGQRRPEGLHRGLLLPASAAAHLQPVLDTLVYLVKETNVWTEITTLLIPGKNDSDEEIERRVQVDPREPRSGRAAALHAPSIPTGR